MQVNFIITCFDKESFVDLAVKTITSYKKISPRICLAYNGKDEKFKCNVRIPNRGHQQGDLDLTLAGYENLLHNEIFRFVKIGADTCLLDEDIIISIFDDMARKRCGYAGNNWHEGQTSLATDIIFADLRFGNAFEGLTLKGYPAYEWAMYGQCEKRKIKAMIIKDRVPVHPDNRNECEKLKWTMHHELDKNIANARKWGKSKSV
jgi:hypothetical protein